MSVHGVSSSLEDAEVLLCCFRGLLGGCVHFDRALNDGHDALLDFLHVMRDVTYHEQEGDHVLIILPEGSCRLVLELHLDVRWAVLKDQVIRPGSVINPGVLIFLVLLLYDHEQIQFDFPLCVVQNLDVQLYVGEPVTGLNHGLTVRNLLFCLKLVVLPRRTYRPHEDSF